MVAEGRASGRPALALIQRTSVGAPNAPDGMMIIGCDAANGSYKQLYADDRGVCRIYEMSIGDGEWKPWRDGEPFSQLFSAKISEDGNTTRIWAGRLTSS